MEDKTLTANKAAEFSDEVQRSLQWHRRRLGYITGSEVSKLMGIGRGKDKAFSDTAESYIEAKAAERCINQSVYSDDAVLQDYLYYNGVIENRSMQYGVMYEDEARAEFAIEIGKEIRADIGSCRHAQIPFFAASPDGIFTDEAGGLVNIEIKVPKEATFARYAARIHSAADLLKIKPEYYWQIIATQACTGAARSYFVTYSRYTEPYLHYVKIERDEAAIAQVSERVKLANAEIDKLVKILKQQ